MAKLITGNPKSNFANLALLSPKNIFLSIFAIVAFGYVFYARFTVGGIKVDAYHQALAIHLGIPLHVSPHDGDFLSFILALSSMIFMYLDHSIWVFNDILMSDNHVGSVLMSTVNFIFAKIISYEYLSHNYAGLFLSLPGALLYDFGTFGLFFAPVIFGLVLAFSYSLLIVRQNSLFRLVIFIASYSIILMAPVLLVHNMIVFVIVVSLLVFLSLISRLSIRQIP
jgi:hypothetical protein